MTVISFFVPEEPFAKRRPRFGKGRIYTDPQTVAAEKALRWYARKALDGRPPLEGPICLETVFFFAIPESNRDKSRAPFTRHTQRPDRDNLEKLVLDALNPPDSKAPKTDWLGMWKDDAQICDGAPRKFWCEAGNAGTRVTIRTMNEDGNWDS